MYLQCQCIMLLCFTNCMSIRNEEYVGDPDKGIFGNFLAQYLDLLAYDCSGKLLKQYCREMSEELNKMDYKYTKDLGKFFRRLSTRYSEDINDEAKVYRQELDRNVYHRTEFLKAMNEVLTLREYVLLEDYINDLRDYCARLVLIDMREYAHKLLYDAIVNHIKRRLNKREQKELEKKLKNAIKEYKDIDLHNFAIAYNISTFRPIYTFSALKPKTSTSALPNIYDMFRPILKQLNAPSNGLKKMQIDIFFERLP